MGITKGRDMYDIMTAETGEPEVLWQEQRYDSGLYRCRVERDGTGGKLTIWLVGTIEHRLHEETVKIDRLDVDKWKLMSEQVISNPSLRSCGVAG